MGNTVGWGSSEMSLALLAVTFSLNALVSQQQQQQKSQKCLLLAYCENLCQMASEAFAVPPLVRVVGGGY